MIYRLLLAVLILISGVSHALEPDKLFEKLSPSVWVVLVYDGEGVRKGHGSAVVIGPEELITNCHGLRKIKTINVKRENTLHSARLIHADVERDLCILRAKGLAAPAVVIAPLSSVRVGQRAYAIGAPQGYELTLSDGLVSSLIRDEEDRIKDIQISVPISPGSSGGGLFDSEGRLIGITSMTQRNAQNLNFARPAEWIEEVPQRAKVALDKLKEQDQVKAAAEVQRNIPAATTQGRQLTGEDLRRHFENLGVVIASSSSVRELKMDFRSNGSLYLNGISISGGATGAYRIKDAEGQLCMSIYSGLGRGLNFMMFQDCYKLYESDSRQFTLRSVTDGTHVEYKLP